MNNVLIIDDEPTIRVLLGRILELEGYETILAKNRMTGLEALRRHDIQIILCDVFLPDGNGIAMVEELVKISPQSKIILLTAHGNISDGVQAIKNGAFDYIVKGDDNMKIIPIVNRAMEEFKKESGVKVPAKKNVVNFDSIIGESACLKNAINMARKVAKTDVCVLLTGETGTGKEIFAQSIHNESPRKNKSFVAVNCSAFSRELLESELFGHKAGSFTGATNDKKGLFEEADGGTIFLDEIGEMEFDMQAKLLRVLESHEFLKVGETKPTKVNVRVIAATNRDLKKEIENKQFREDLYFRISVFQINLPPIRERTGDPKLLAEHFTRCMAENIQHRKIGISQECLKLMNAYSWPGNIRELRNVIERALIVCDSEIKPDDLPVDLRMNNNTAAPSSEFDLATVERNHIVKILTYTKGNKTETARLLKIGLTTLYRKIEEYNIPSDTGK